MSAFPATVWLLLAAAMLISSIGFYKYVYFISLGYGFSIAGLGLLILFLFRDSLSLGPVLACILFFVYGCRLGGFLLIRELKSASYRATMKTEIKDGSTMGFGVKCAIWITCALLYALQVLPVFYRMVNGVQEWLNPPMELGVEYKTTERYMGKPVYTKIVDFGDGPNKTYKEVSHGMDISYCRVIGCEIFRYNGSSLVLPMGSTSITSDFTYGGAISDKIRICSTTDVSGSKFHVIIKYVKTTD